MKAPTESPSRGLTQSQTVRLECLRLVFNPNKDAQYLIAKAEEFERYVTDGTQQEQESGSTTPIVIKLDGQGDPTAPV